MELYLKLYIQMIDLEKSGFSDIRFESPEELVYLFGEEKLSIIEPSRLCYHLNDSQGVFVYLDRLETRVPKVCYEASWEWGGVRQNNVYYIDIHGQGLVGAELNLLEAILDVFPDGLTVTEDFDYPVIERDSEDDEYNWNEKEYDDDSDLRIVEECTYGREWIQWYRPFPETEGFSGDTLIALVSLVVNFIPLALSIKDRIRIKLRKCYYSCKIARLRRIVIKQTHCKGHIRSPKPMPPKYINAETGKKEYMFYQILDDDRQRKIFIGIDGKGIHKGKLY